MNWKTQLAKMEKENDWKSSVELMKKVIREGPPEAEAYIRAIYLLHHILLEVGDMMFEHDQLASLLKYYFEKSYELFSNDPEYLFFMGKILYIAEWYFGIDDDLKPVEERQAFRMQKKAFEMEPKNVLFGWAYMLSTGSPIMGFLAKQILLYDKQKVEWLQSKGFPGEYILDQLTMTMKEYEANDNNK